MMRTSGIYLAAAMLEIGGCFAVWSVLRRDAALGWLALAAAALAGFAWLLAQSEQAFAGRAFAAYGGVYVAASLAWLAAVERTAPTASDLIGGALVLAGATVIVWGARA